jgi:hypothetical protein
MGRQLVFDHVKPGLLPGKVEQIAVGYIPEPSFAPDLLLYVKVDATETEQFGLYFHDSGL